MRWIPVNEEGSLNAFVDIEKVVKVVFVQREPELPTNNDGVYARLFVATSDSMAFAGEVNFSDAVNELRRVVQEDLQSYEQPS